MTPRKINEARDEAQRFIDRCAGQLGGVPASLVPQMVALIRDILPKNVCTTNPNIPDDLVVPLDVTMGELRRVAAILSKLDGAAS